MLNLFSGPTTRHCRATEPNQDDGCGGFVDPRHVSMGLSFAMRPTDRMELMSRIGRELQSRFTYTEIDEFLAAYKLKGPAQIDYNSKWRYSREALQGVDNALLLKIAEDLDLEVPARGAGAAVPPRNWATTSELRLFISHISKHKEKATRLKTCLAPYGISGFVAHEDIHPTLEWQKEIERSLYAMDAFLAIHTPGFSRSIWTQQEIGFALGRGVKIISFKMGEDPTGFIAKQQALARRDRTAEAIAEEVSEILSGDERTAAKMLAAKKAAGLDKDDEIPF